MYALQYVGKIRRALAHRGGGRPPLAVEPFSPVPVAQDATEAEQKGFGRRFFTLKDAQRLFDHGGGNYQWVGAVPPKLLSGKLPDGFPHREALGRAQIRHFETVPRDEPGLLALNVLGDVSEKTGKILMASARKAAGEILDELDRRIKGEEV